MLRLLLLLAVSLLLAFSAPAAAQTRDAEDEARLSAAEKRAIQEALVWGGYYEARIDGVIGPATRSAIRQFQSAEGFRPTGYLRQRHLDQLLDVRERWTDRFGWEIRRFPRLGMQIGVPADLLGEPEPHDNGLRFRSDEDEPRSQLVLYSAPPMSDARFEDLREDLIDRQHFSREVYDAGDADWFVFSGTSEAGVEQYTYVVNREHGARGFSFRYLERHAEELSRLNTALYNSLQTFAAEGEQVPETAEREEAPAERPAREGGALFSERELALLEGEDGAADEPRTRRERQSVGFLVNPDGAILTTASAIDGCQRVRANRRADATIAAIDREHDLALLRVPTEGRAFPHLSFRGRPIHEGDRLRALTFGGDETGLEVSPGSIEALSGGEGDILRFRVSTELRPASRGAPLIDEAGRVAGLAVGRPASASETDEVLPPAQRLATRSGVLEAFLGAHGVAYEVRPGEGEPQEALPPAIRLATLRIECVR